jgi:tetratricopeptide (TPR) repeat protein
VPRLTRSLTDAPATIPALLAVVVFVVWAASEAGFPTTDWYPGTLLLLGLLAATAGALRPRAQDLPRPVLVATALLAAFTAWSFLSIAWADARGDAWDGANRTLLYLVVFVLFAAWAQRGETAAALVSVWILALAAIAAVTLVQVTTSDRPLGMFLGDRLNEPAGYANANAALFLMPFWAAVVLASARDLPAALRGGLAGSAVLLGGVALIVQSRGGVYSTPIVLIALFVLLPGRARMFATAVPIAAALAAVTPRILDATRQIRDGGSATEALDPLALAIALAAAAAAIAVGIGAALERRTRSPRARRTAHRVAAAVGLATAAVALAVALALAGNPVEAAGDGWDSFKRGYGTPSERGRLLSGGLGSNRYDFYRVALDSFRDSPLVGIGADNFAQDYLLDRRSEETPRYPHSLELRTLAQTGIVGTLLLAGALIAALAAGLRAARRADRLGAATAAAATAAFLYWTVHGSVDWFWEFAGLGAPAFALLGLACALYPRRAPAPVAGAPDLAEPDAPPPEPSATRPPRRDRSLPATLAATALVLVAAASLALPWLARVETDRAGRTWPDDPRLAERRLDRAASLNPLSDRPHLVAATIALERRRYGEARERFEKALERNERSAYAVLELGALASMRGDRAQAVRLLERAARLDPRDPPTRAALASARAGRRVDVHRLNRAIRERAENLV